MSQTEYHDEFGLLMSVSLISPDLAIRKAEIANRIADENETVQKGTARRVPKTAWHQAPADASAE